MTASSLGYIGARCARLLSSAPIDDTIAIENLPMEKQKVSASWCGDGSCDLERRIGETDNPSRRSCQESGTSTNQREMGAGDYVVPPQALGAGAKQDTPPVVRRAVEATVCYLNPDVYNANWPSLLLIQNQGSRDRPV